MDVIKEIAIRFSQGIRTHAVSLEKFDSQLNSKLIYISKNAEKLRFLAYLKDILETNYQRHAIVCKNPANCQENRCYEIALYSVQQQYDDYYKIEGGYSINEKSAMKFFVEGQYFDAFTAIKECIKEAKNSIILIDGYVDENTLAFFPGKEPSITLRILTKEKSITPTFKRAIELYNKQYGNLEIKTSENYHDRFLILDDKIFYHIGASIKDAGNKVFMYSKIEDSDIMNLIRSKLPFEWGNIIL